VNRVARTDFKGIAFGFALLVITGLFCPQFANAGPCRSNRWQPTFVHDLRPGFYPGPFYVMPNGSFVRLINRNNSYVDHACSMINRFGVRNRLGYTTCRDYTRIQCGCDLMSRRNSTCARFLVWMNQNRTPPPSAAARGTAVLLGPQFGGDMVGRNEAFQGNGRRDRIFRARINAPGRTIVAVEVRNINGAFSVWDTKPGNGRWLGAVRAGGRTMNQRDGSVNFRLGQGTVSLDFYVEDAGSIAGGRTRFRMTVFFARGNPLVMDVDSRNAPGNATGTAWLLRKQHGPDVVGRNEVLKGNGKRDRIFRAKISAPGRTVVAVEVRNTNGVFSVWDTKPRNGHWLGAVLLNGRRVYKNDGSVYFRLGNGQATLDMLVEDQGAISGNRTRFRMTVEFANGKPLIMDVR
jgi:hypothetical protein